MTNFWAILLANLCLYDRHQFIDCPGHSRICRSRLMHFIRFGSCRFVILFGRLIRSGYQNSMHDLLGLYVCTSVFQSPQCFGWQLAASEITWFPFGRFTCTCPLPDTIRLHICICINCNLSNTVHHRSSSDSQWDSCMRRNVGWTIISQWVCLWTITDLWQ